MKSSKNFIKNFQQLQDDFDCDVFIATELDNSISIDITSNKNPIINANISIFENISLDDLSKIPFSKTSTSNSIPYVSKHFDTLAEFLSDWVSVAKKQLITNKYSPLNDIISDIQISQQFINQVSKFFEIDSFDLYLATVSESQYCLYFKDFDTIKGVLYWFKTDDIEDIPQELSEYESTVIYTPQVLKSIDKSLSFASLISFVLLKKATFSNIETPKSYIQNELEPEEGLYLSVISNNGKEQYSYELISCMDDRGFSYYVTINDNFELFMDQLGWYVVSTHNVPLDNMDFFIVDKKNNSESF